MCVCVIWILVSSIYLGWSGYLSFSSFLWARIGETRQWCTSIFIVHTRFRLKHIQDIIVRPKANFSILIIIIIIDHENVDETRQAAEMPSPSSFSLDFNQTIELLLLLYQSIITMSVQLNYLYVITWKSPPFSISTQHTNIAQYVRFA